MQGHPYRMLLSLRCELNEPCLSWFIEFVREADDPSSVPAVGDVFPFGYFCLDAVGSIEKETQIRCLLLSVTALYVRETGRGPARFSQFCVLLILGCCVS